MSDIGFNDDVNVGGRKFHVQTASHLAQGTASCEVFEQGRLINKNYVTFERRHQTDMEKFENRIRNVVESVHDETLQEIELMFSIAEKINGLKHAPSHVKMGLLFVKNNLINDGIRHFEKAIELNKNEIDAYNNLGLAQIKLKNYDTAIRTFETALRINKDYPDVHHNLGMAYYLERQHFKSIDHIQTALRMNPDYKLARYNLALVYLDSILSDKKDTKLPPASIRAERSLQQLKELKLKNISSVMSKVQKALKQKDVKAAVKVLESMREKVFPEDLYNLIGIDFYLRFMFGGKSLTNRSLVKFERDLARAIELRGEYADLWNSLGIVHLIQCRNLFLQALSEFNRALEINPNFEKALKNKKLVENDGKEFLILLRAILK
ncbi:MAG TPA: tetratricopeptide repeat protein [Caldithrix abyssi]|uniref:Tetratricopeptide repeat protein n=1 Tax=Caldithrix abyssi TaxID=187145 RepID=A0A7V1PW96_CALAY|nr:tetratricopeptide repeat protein [Caldithrix abyssi]